MQSQVIRHRQSASSRPGLFVALRVLMIAVCVQLVNTRTVEAYNMKLEQKRVEFVKLKDDSTALKASVAELSSQLAVRVAHRLL